MTDQNEQPRPVIETVGAYTGGRPASEVGPPPKTPSGTADVPAARKKRAK